MSELLRKTAKDNRATLVGLKQGARDRFKPDSYWKFYNSSLWEYNVWFTNLLDFKPVESLLDNVKNPVVIDLMAPSGTLNELFLECFKSHPNKKGICVSLEDLRDHEQIEDDERLGITQITGDLTRSATWKKVEEELGGRKADLIIERGYGGLYGVPNHLAFHGIALQRMWGMLAVDGTMLVGLPPSTRLSSLGLKISTFRDTLRGAGFDIKYDRTSNSIRMQKKADSPNVLPLNIIPLNANEPLIYDWVEPVVAVNSGVLEQVTIGNAEEHKP